MSQESRSDFSPGEDIRGVRRLPNEGMVAKDIEFVISPRKRTMTPAEGKRRETELIEGFLQGKINPLDVLDHFTDESIDVATAFSPTSFPVSGRHTSGHGSALRGIIEYDGNDGRVDNSRG